MRGTKHGIAAAVGGILLLACRQNAPQPLASSESGDIQGIQIATDAYVAYQHSDCETVYRLTQPDLIDEMQETELRYSLRLVRGYCQELDGDQPAARVTYRRVIDERATSFAAEDARERLRILDLQADDPEFLPRVEEAARRATRPSTPREPSVRTAAHYPPVARAAAVEGFAVVEFGVGRDGKTVDPIVVASDPPFIFEGTALRAVRGWIYKTQRSADPDARQAIRIVFRSTLEPVTLEQPDAAPADPSASTPFSTPIIAP